MSRPRLTVVIRTHNGAETLVSCLHALRVGTPPPDEIIVVDDVSVGSKLRT